ncbi:xanthine/uracil permease [Brucella melitensis bv. 1 str. 16M]|uniref:Xanthine/uracil permease n=1 Tax=Brucella melitensis biotype 1 (strain ATCC 23456 / CCUG 17765 / NCTC 10094 / 16M) TaxID=224914 RepID=Q8YCB5_BRUME|nr:xanthine/uracil permease [Brucella melitensis bv. 1 str. 16M]
MLPGSETCRRGGHVVGRICLGGMMFEKLFKLQEHGTSARTEIIAGVTTFLTMSYIIFVNPDILSTTGMDRNAVFVATCLAAALGSIIMALVANWPIGMAPGMGLNAFFAFTVVGAMGFSWQQALGAVFISGVIFLLLTVTGVRPWLVDGIPHSLRTPLRPVLACSWRLLALKVLVLSSAIRQRWLAWAISRNPARFSPLQVSSSSPFSMRSRFAVQSSSAFWSSPLRPSRSASASLAVFFPLLRASRPPSCSSISWARCIPASSMSFSYSCWLRFSMPPAH